MHAEKYGPECRQRRCHSRLTQTDQTHPRCTETDKRHSGSSLSSGGFTVPGWPPLFSSAVTLGQESSRSRKSATTDSSATLGTVTFEFLARPSLSEWSASAPTPCLLPLCNKFRLC